MWWEVDGADDDGGESLGSVRERSVNSSMEVEVGSNETRRSIVKPDIIVVDVDEPEEALVGGEWDWLARAEEVVE